MRFHKSAVISNKSSTMSSKSLITILTWAKLEVYPQKHILEPTKMISHTSFLSSSLFFPTVALLLEQVYIY